MDIKLYEQLETMYCLKKCIGEEMQYYTTIYNEAATYKDPDHHSKALGFESLIDIQTYYGVKTSMAKRLALDIKNLESRILGV